MGVGVGGVVEGTAVRLLRRAEERLRGTEEGVEQVGPEESPAAAQCAPGGEGLRADSEEGGRGEVVMSDPQRVGPGSPQDQHMCAVAIVE